MSISCQRFVCRVRPGRRRYCCADCDLRGICEERCLNGPERCGLSGGMIEDEPPEKSHGCRTRAEMAEARQAMARLYALGLSDARIAEESGVTPNTVAAWRRKTGLPPNHPKKGGGAK